MSRGSSSGPVLFARIKQSSGTSEEPDQNPTSGLVLHCLRMSHKKDARLKGLIQHITRVS